ncbi:GNAT family N-acetyltransferase [Nocardia crassostreae]|uniref:GNAT family N-acetyltransferase n=1 Tax=Nocardia crassostreae TaxID=53428 RepID=UPI00082AB4D9|nr:GNAT family N-acetyltransferase [Nocardia crassostreae]
MGNGFDIVSVRRATRADVGAIRRVLAANAADASLFQQSGRRILRDLDDFVIAETGERPVGCAALHRHTRANAEILAVAVDPVAQNRGVGALLMQACLTKAAESGAAFVWLATAKPAYFARYDFRPISKWTLPPRVVLRKFRLVFEQPARRWVPALRGRHTFMRLPTPATH